MIPEGKVILEVKNFDVLPREVLLDDSKVFFTWRGASPRCRYCKTIGHVKKYCPKISYKKLDTKLNKNKRNTRVQTANHQQTKSHKEIISQIDIKITIYNQKL